MSTPAPLKSITVVDLSQGIAGPGCGMLLAVWGADVIKVEPPQGDWIRGLGTRKGELSSNTIPYNVGKRSIAVDLKHSAGVDAVRALLSHADVLLESFRPGVLDRLGLGFDAVNEINPDLIYASVSGFGQRGPYVARPCSDTIAQAYSGFMSVNSGADDIPHKVDTTIVDAVTSLYAFQSLSMHLMASRQGETAARGLHLDLSLAGASAAIQAPKIVDWVMAGGDAGALNAPAGSYQTEDGWMVVTLVKEAQYAKLVEALGLPELAKDERFDSFQNRARNIEPLRDALQARFVQKPTSHWLEHLSRQDVLCNAINTYGDWLEDPQVLDQELAMEYQARPDLTVPLPRIPGAPLDIDARVPGIGEHSREILGAAGFAKKTIDALVADGTIIAAD